ncbi:MAG TPA: hypothetical protein VL832_23190 [Puia sp.]|jgi:chromosome segregation ATPase|nr:hypothetical protein [Puia sp.]
MQKNEEFKFAQDTAKFTKIKVGQDSILVSKKDSIEKFKFILAKLQGDNKTMKEIKERLEKDLNSLSPTLQKCLSESVNIKNDYKILKESFDITIKRNDSYRDSLRKDNLAMNYRMTKLDWRIEQFQVDVTNRNQTIKELESDLKKCKEERH